MKSVLILAATLSCLSAEARVESFFSPADNLDQAIKNEIKKAQSSIQMSIYTFGSTGLRSEILKKMKSGVDVKIIVNKGADAKEFLAPLADAGAKIKTPTKINHHKFIIIDERTIVNSSENFSSSARAKSYDGNLVVCEDECMTQIEQYQQEFDQLFKFSKALENTSDITVSAADRKSPVHINYDESFFTSSNFVPYNYRGKPSMKSKKQAVGKVEKRLIDAIDSANTEILVATGHFRSKNLFDALASAVERGVKVKLVLDSQEYISSYYEKKQQKKIEECLKKYSKTKCYSKGLYFSRAAEKAGIDVKIKYYSYRWHFPYAAQMHHKYMVIDSETVYTGSYNWSYNAEYNTLENVWVETNTSVVKSYKANFNKVFNLNSNKYQGFYNDLKNEQDEIETHFSPMTLTIDQIQKIKGMAGKKCKDLYTNPIEWKSCRV